MLHELQVLGNGFEVISVGKRKLVRSVPTELNKDHNEILELAQVTTASSFYLSLKLLSKNNIYKIVYMFILLSGLFSFFVI